MITRSFGRHCMLLAVGTCLSLALSSAAIAQNRPAVSCCTVTAIDSEKGLVTAKERTAERTFQFIVSDRVLLASLKIGAPVYANYQTRQVSLDGKKDCCTILGGAAVATRPAPVIVKPAEPVIVKPAAPVIVKPTEPVIVKPAEPVIVKPAEPVIVKPAEPVIVKPAEPGPAAGQPRNIPIALPLPRLLELPILTAGALQNVQGKKTDWQDGGESLRRLQDPNLVQLRGIPGIREVAGLPQVATDLLVMHARTLRAEVLDSYIVSPKLAEEWLKANPLPPDFVASVRKSAMDDGKSKKKCNTISTGCATDRINETVDDLTKAWRNAWDDTVDELGRLLGRVDDIKACFADQTLSLSEIPVKFSAEPRIPLSIGKDSAKRGGASGNVSGSLTVGVPVNGDFRAQVNVFYIPCLPFAVRPKSIAANGNMSVGGSFTANVLATGEFQESFTVPPMGGIQIPIAVLPIALGGVTIAVLDISVFLDGTLDVSGEGRLEGNLKLESIQSSDFAFECSGHGCEFTQESVPSPATAVESVKLDGRIKIKPAIYSALQLSLNYDVLSARAGPQPFLLGEIYGCAAASATQNTAGTSSGEQSYALTADLDWGMEFRAEALARGKKAAEAPRWQLFSRHIYFKDLAQSTALKPGVAGTLQPSLGQPAAYTAQMPACYPYPDEIELQVRWTGDATVSSDTPNPGATKGIEKGSELGLPEGLAGRTASSSAPSTTCTVQAGRATCKGTPLAITSLNLTWPALGDYILTVTPVGDKHGRRFDSSRATQINIQVQQ